MANAIYPKFKQAVMGGGDQAAANLLSGTVVASLIDTGTYTYNEGHEYEANLTGFVANVVGLSAKTVTNGIFDAANVTFTSVSGATAEAVIIWIDTGTPGTSRLVAYLDTNITGLPVTPNGGDINLNWNTTGIFRL